MVVWARSAQFGEGPPATVEEFTSETGGWDPVGVWWVRPGGSVVGCTVGQHTCMYVLMCVAARGRGRRRGRGGVGGGGGEGEGKEEGEGEGEGEEEGRGRGRRRGRGREKGSAL